MGCNLSKILYIDMTYLRFETASCLNLIYRMSFAVFFTYDSDYHLCTFSKSLNQNFNENFIKRYLYVHTVLIFIFLYK